MTPLNAHDGRSERLLEGAPHGGDVEEGLRLERHHTNAGLFVVAAGPLDELSTSSLLDVCRGAEHIELDLRDVSFVSLAGIEALMEIAQSSTLCILAASPVVRGAIDAAGLAHILHTDRRWLAR